MVPNTAADFEEQQQPQALARLRTLAQYYLTSNKLLIFFEGYWCGMCADVWLFVNRSSKW